MCSYSYRYYLNVEYKLCQCARTRIVPPSRPRTRPLVMLICCFFWRSNRSHCLFVLVMRAIASSIHVRTYLVKFNKQMYYHDTYRSTRGIFLTIIFFVLGQNTTPIWKYRLITFYFPVFCSFKLCRRQAKQMLESTTPKTKCQFGIHHALQTSRYNRRLESTSSNYNIFATSRLSRPAPIRVHVEVRNG